MASTLKLPVGIENFEEIRKLGFYYATLCLTLLNFFMIWHYYLINMRETGIHCF